MNSPPLPTPPTPINTIIPTHTGTSHLISPFHFPNPLYTTHLNLHTSHSLPHGYIPLTTPSHPSPITSPTLTSPSNPLHTTHLNPHTLPHLTCPTISFSHPTHSHSNQFSQPTPPTLTSHPLSYHYIPRTSPF
ncbi:hypothetical protein Pcinc_006251 [Petrolisthes cinctipes]|uniref:Uncharacterized protein n=1 Tax=Petrolisthes cinctipes TaxID=88211 RepID=A0AAE1GD52_PETCI|nr:hypothetical protein Pcinc_006251 [Petrolisthes cinctipes]